MKTKAGIWIDRQKAVIVLITKNTEGVRIIKSNSEKYFDPSSQNGNNYEFGRKDFPAYDIIERYMEMHVRNFYDRVISLIRDADSIYIFGPAEAKTGLKKRIEENRFMTRNVTTEPAYKMSYNEILEKVRQHYVPRVAYNTVTGTYAHSVGA